MSLEILLQQPREIEPVLIEAANLSREKFKLYMEGLMNSKFIRQIQMLEQQSGLFCLLFYRWVFVSWYYSTLLYLLYKHRGVFFNNFFNKVTAW